MTHAALRKSGAEGSESSMPIHMAELGSDNFEQEFTLSLLANEEDRLGMIETALQRIEDGEYGQCEECGGVIAKTRLNGTSLHAGVHQVRRVAGQRRGRRSRRLGPAAAVTSAVRGAIGPAASRCSADVPRTTRHGQRIDVHGPCSPCPSREPPSAVLAARGAGPAPPTCGPSTGCSASRDLLAGAGAVGLAGARRVSAQPERGGAVRHGAGRRVAVRRLLDRRGGRDSHLAVSVWRGPRSAADDRAGRRSWAACWAICTIALGLPGLDWGRFRSPTASRRAACYAVRDFVLLAWQWPPRRAMATCGPISTSPIRCSCAARIALVLLSLRGRPTRRRRRRA